MPAFDFIWEVLSAVVCFSQRAVRVRGIVRCAWLLAVASAVSLSCVSCRLLLCWLFAERCGRSLRRPRLPHVREIRGAWQDGTRRAGQRDKRSWERATDAEAQHSSWDRQGEQRQRQMQMQGRCGGREQGEEGEEVQGEEERDEKSFSGVDPRRRPSLLGSAGVRDTGEITVRSCVTWPSSIPDLDREGVRLKKLVLRKRVWRGFENVHAARWWVARQSAKKGKTNEAERRAKRVASRERGRHTRWQSCLSARWHSLLLLLLLLL